MLKNKNTLACFSPPVMLATFAIEMILLVAVLLTKRLDSVAKLIVCSLFCLGFFQLAEYFVCGGLGIDSELWSRLGFAAITTLPPLGLHIIYAIKGAKPDWQVILGYSLMLIWILFFTFMPGAFKSNECVSNYVIFNLKDHVNYPYTLYYYGVLFWGMWRAYSFAGQTKQQKTKQALYAMIVGYLVFLLPTATVNVVSPKTMAGIPSIMCGFAVLFALILYFYVLPRTAQKK